MDAHPGKCRKVLEELMSTCSLWNVREKMIKSAWFVINLSIRHLKKGI